MLKFAFRNMAVKKSRLLLVMLSVLIASGVALLAYNVSMQVEEGIVTTAAYYDMIIGPSGSATQLAMNTMFFTDEPLGTIPYSYVEELEASGLTNAVIPFTMGDSYNAAKIVGAVPEFLDGKPLATGEMFEDTFEAVLGSAVAEKYHISVGDTLITSHGLTGSGAEHADNPLTVTGILKKTNTSYDNQIFTSYKTVWAVHDHGHHDHDHEDETHEDGMHKEETHEEEHTHDETAHEEHNHEESAHEDGIHEEETHEEEHTHDETAHEEHNHEGEEHDHEGEEHEHEDGEHEHIEQGEVCAILVRAKSFNDYYKLLSAYKGDANLLAINPSTVLREVMEQVDLSTEIVYILCGIILIMNLLVISVITLLNLFDSKKEIALMRLIGVRMSKIALLYLLQNGIVAVAAALCSMLLSHVFLSVMQETVSSMGIVLNVWSVYPMEWGILGIVVAISVLPTLFSIFRMAKGDTIK
ncbi:MAG: ABC transporter permease [Christensenellales bacterium]|jgi:putative ABC transport system permease protein